jgi:ABC-type nitrate/sulfonate/bicarbonate transport system permease component
MSATNPAIAASPHAERRPEKLSLRGLGKRALGAVAVIVALLAWQAATMAAGSLFFPTPLAILLRMRELWLSGPPQHLFLTAAVGGDIVPSLARMLGGWALAAVAGVALGVAIGRLRLLAEIIDPSLQFLRAVPGPALVPIFLILLGTGTTMRVSLIAFGSVWPILLNTVEGVRTVDPTHLRTAEAFRLPRRARLFRIVLPSALPKIMAGLRVSLAIALILMVISEMIASTNGIGYEITRSLDLFRFTDMWANIVLLAVVGFALNGLFNAVERRVLRWHAASRRRGETSKVGSNA